MGVDYSYVCVLAKRKKVVFEFDDCCLWLFDLQFEDEHGHKFAPIIDVLVRIGENSAGLVKYAENVVRGVIPDSVFGEIEVLCKNYPGYNVYDGEEFWKFLHGLPCKYHHLDGSVTDGCY